MDLLKALIAENQIKLAQHVIKLYRQGNFQVKIHNLQLVQEAESMVPPLVEQFITTTV